MSPKFPTQAIDPRSSWTLTASGARRAAERAKNAARVAGAWAERAGAGEAEAAAAVQAACSAQRAAERAESATSLEEIRGAAAAAWLAMEAALEADKRTGLVIAAAMWACLDRRLTEESRQAA